MYVNEKWRKDALTHTPSPTHTHRLTPSLTHSFTHTHTHTLSLSLSLSLPLLLPCNLIFRGRFPPRAIKVLKQWLKDNADNPYPSEPQKEQLMTITGLDLTQLNNWYTCLLPIFLFFIFWVQVKPEAGAHFILVPLVPFCSYPLLLYVSCVSCMPVSVSLSVSVQVHQWSQAHFDESGQ